VAFLLVSCGVRPIVLLHEKLPATTHVKEATSVMTHRERMLRALEYREPDKLPVYYHPSHAGMYLHGRKLLELFSAFPPDNAPEDSEEPGIPAPEPECLAPDGSYHKLETDEWGTQWEYCTFGLQGSPRVLPLSDPDLIAGYRLPPAPEPGGPAFEMKRKEIAARRNEYASFGGWMLLFEKACELRPMEDVLVELYTGEQRMLELLDRIVERTAKCIHYELALGRDVILFGDDWGFQNGPAISPEKFREVFAPRYRSLFERIRQAGAKVLFHSCGQLGGILEELFALQIDCIWHQAGCYEPKDFAQQCREHQCAALLHPDRQHLIPYGRPDEIREAVARYCQIYHDLGGGGVFYVEIEADAPFENIEALITAIDQYR
jgi:uroporphyrinogen decarboxylase